jgi:hypothetical protein
MRVMMILKSDPMTEAGTPPTQEALEAMGKYNEEMVRAGVMLDGAGLKPSSQAARVRFEDGEARVLDGPFAETKELLAGFWVIQVQSMDEAVEWAKRCPHEHIPKPDGYAEIELRPYFELDDFEEGEGLDRHRKLQTEMDAKKQQ